MPDISMCQNDSCPLKEKCYRFMAIPDDVWQSYTEFKYELDNCDYFYPLEKGHMIRYKPLKPKD